MYCTHKTVNNSLCIYDCDCIFGFSYLDSPQTWWVVLLPRAQPQHMSFHEKTISAFVTLYCAWTYNDMMPQDNSPRAVCATCHLRSKVVVMNCHNAWYLPLWPASFHESCDCLNYNVLLHSISQRGKEHGASNDQHLCWTQSHVCGCTSRQSHYGGSYLPIFARHVCLGFQQMVRPGARSSRCFLKLFGFQVSLFILNSQ